jgi:drug/metabolite transporter (DMT)-like permease
MTLPPVPRPRAGVSPQDQRSVVRGLGFVLIAMIVLPGQDTVAKFLSGTISPGQINWARFLLQTLFTLPFLLYFHGPDGLVPKRIWPNVVRGALIAASSMLFFTALKFMPIADALAIFFVEPFVLTILSAVVDGEHVGWRRRIAVAAGFIGVLIVVQPSWDVFGPVSLLPGAAGTTFAVYLILNRRLSRFDEPLTMQFAAGLSALVVMTLVLIAGWAVGVPDFSPTPFTPREGALLVLMGILGTGGHLAFVYGGKHAPSSLIAPLQYVEIVFAVIFGYLVFGDFPSPVKWLGILIIVWSGAYVFWRESRRSARSDARAEG